MELSIFYFGHLIIQLTDNMKNKGVFRLYVFSFRRIKQLYAFELL